MKKPLKVYVAGPLFSSGLVHDNIREAVDLAHVIKEAGALPFVPHLYFFWNLMRPAPEDYWLELDKMWVEDCDVLYRFGEHSEGADKEEFWAGEKPIFYRRKDLFNCIKKYNKTGKLEEA
jgi:hypothetical protein